MSEKLADTEVAHRGRKWGVSVLAGILSLWLMAADSSHAHRAPSPAELVMQQLEEPDFKDALPPSLYHDREAMGWMREVAFDTAKTGRGIASALYSDRVHNWCPPGTAQRAELEIDPGGMITGVKLTESGADRNTVSVIFGVDENGINPHDLQDVKIFYLSGGMTHIWSARREYDGVTTVMWFFSTNKNTPDGQEFTTDRVIKTKDTLKDMHDEFMALVGGVAAQT